MKSRSDVTQAHIPEQKLEGGTKYDGQKLRYDLIPVLPMERVAEVYTIGAEKYDDRNWENGISYSRVVGALKRHLEKWWGGEKLDKDGGQHHLASVVWCALALMEFERTHPEKDDRMPRNKPFAPGATVTFDGEKLFPWPAPGELFTTTTDPCVDNGDDLSGPTTGDDIKVGGTD